MLEEAELGERAEVSEYPPCGKWTPPARRSLPPLRTVVAKISHDLRTPLAAILANAEFLTEMNLKSEDRMELYQEIRASIDRMNELIADLLECAKGEEMLRPAVGNIVEMTESVVKMIGVRPAFRRIKITHRHEGATTGWYNARRLERAMWNIVLNACEAVSPETGQVEITTVGGSSCLRIEVRDNGPGIPAKIQDSVFQPFFTHGKPEGTGLGLAIAKRIIEDHGGVLFLDAGKEKGTSFKMSIPIRGPEEALA